MHTPTTPSSSRPAQQADILTDASAGGGIVRVVRKGSPAPKKKAAKKTTAKKPAPKKTASAKSAAIKPAKKAAAKATTKKAAVKKTAAKKAPASKAASKKAPAKKAAPTRAATAKSIKGKSAAAAPKAVAPKPAAKKNRGAQDSILPASTSITAITEPVKSGAQNRSTVVDFDSREAGRPAVLLKQPPREQTPTEPARRDSTQSSQPKAPAPKTDKRDASLERDRQPAPKPHGRPEPKGQPQSQPQNQSHSQQKPSRGSAPAAPKPSAPSKPAKPAAEPHIEEPADEVLPGPHGREQIFEQATTFADLGLRNSVLKGLEECGFKHPTTIQAKLIPEILSGQDVLGQAKTGTGKTAAFGLPMLNKIEKGAPFQGLILVPTRELAIQVDSELRKLGKFTPLRSLPVYGGQNVRTQAERLAKGPEIIVATPGRIMDMAQRGYVHYHNIKMVVLDEVDRMLDIGFREDIRKILSSCPKHPQRQTVFVSATISGDIEKLAHSHAHNAKKVIASTGSLTVAMVKQFYLPVERWDKRRLLLYVLKHEDPALTIVFCRMKRTVDDVAKYLESKGVDVHAIHGDMYQSSRNKVIEKLRAGDLSVLVASDLAARGIDVDGITHVINYDLPEDPDIYVHRIGRTARAGRDGVAWAFVTPEQGELLTQIELLINAEIPKLEYPGFVPGPVPQDIQASRQADSQRREQTKGLNRYAQSAPAAMLQAHAGAGGGGGGNGVAAAAPDHSRFPGGVVPTKLPPRMLQGRIKTARSLKQAMRPAAAPANAAPAHPPVVQPHRPHAP